MNTYDVALTELDNMMPWEREIYVNLLLQWLEEEKERQKEQNRKARQMNR